MDCRFILQNDIHEKFLLEKLSENDKRAYLYHLESCASCREEQERQRILIAGIRVASKQEMKAEIRRQVEDRSTTRSKFDRTILYKAAAVLFFFVITPGLIVYYWQSATMQSPEMEKMAAPGKQKYMARPQLPPPDLAEEAEADAGGESIASLTDEEHQAEGSGLAGAGAAGQKAREEKRSAAAASGEKSARRNRLRLTETVEPLEPLITTETGTIEQRDAAMPPDKAKIDEVNGIISGEKQVKTQSTAKERQLFVFALAEDKKISRLNKEMAYTTNDEAPAKPADHWRFVSGEEEIIVKPVISGDEAVADSGSFKIELLKKDSLSLKLKWHLNSAFSGIHPRNVQIWQHGDILRIKVGRESIFRYRITGGSTEAVKEQP